MVKPPDVRTNPDNIQGWQESGGLETQLPPPPRLCCGGGGLGSWQTQQVFGSGASRLLQTISTRSRAKAQRHRESAQPRSELKAINWTERNRAQRETIHPGSITLPASFLPLCFMSRLPRSLIALAGLQRDLGRRRGGASREPEPVIGWRRTSRDRVLGSRNPAIVKNKPGRNVWL